jgi:hypothetical protein
MNAETREVDMAHESSVRVNVKVTMHLFNVYGLAAGIGLVSAGLLMAYDCPWGVVGLGISTMIYFVIKMLIPRDKDEAVREITGGNQ